MVLRVARILLEEWCRVNAITRYFDPYLKQDMGDEEIARTGRMFKRAFEQRGIALFVLSRSIRDLTEH